MGKTLKLQVTEIDGNRYADLVMAQQAAIEDVARELAAVVREGIVGKNLVVVDGIVKLANDFEED